MSVFRIVLGGKFGLFIVGKPNGPPSLNGIGAAIEGSAIAEPAIRGHTLEAADVSGILDIITFYSAANAYRE